MTTVRHRPTVDALLGREFLLHRAGSPGTITSRVTLTDYDPDKGWFLWSHISRVSSAWIPDDLFIQIYNSELMEAA